MIDAEIVNPQIKMPSTAREEYIYIYIRRATNVYNLRHVAIGCTYQTLTICLTAEVDLEVVLVGTELDVYTMPQYCTHELDRHAYVQGIHRVIDELMKSQNEAIR